MANLLQRVSATAAIATSVVGLSAVAAPQAIAGNNDDGNVALQAGNESAQAIGNSSSSGYMSPNMAVIQGGVINCFGMNKIPLQGAVGALIGGGIGVQDVLTDQVNQVCSPNAMQQTGDDPLAHLLSSVLSENG